MLLEFILILQLVNFLFFFNINRFFLNDGISPPLFFGFVLSSAFILFLVYYNAYYNMTTSEPFVVHLFLQEKKE
jgi:hypothetical protein